MSEDHCTYPQNWNHQTVEAINKGAAYRRSPLAIRRYDSNRRGGFDISRFPRIFPVFCFFVLSMEESIKSIEIEHIQNFFFIQYSFSLIGGLPAAQEAAYGSLDQKEI